MSRRAVPQIPAGGVRPATRPQLPQFDRPASVPGGANGPNRPRLAENSQLGRHAGIDPPTTTHPNDEWVRVQHNPTACSTTFRGVSLAITHFPLSHCLQKGRSVEDDTALPSHRPLLRPGTTPHKLHMPASSHTGARFSVAQRKWPNSIHTAAVSRIEGCC